MFLENDAQSNKDGKSKAIQALKNKQKKGGNS